MSFLATKAYTETNFNVYDVLVTPADYNYGDSFTPSAAILFVSVNASGVVGQGAPISTYTVKLQSDATGKDTDPTIHINGDSAGIKYFISGSNMSGIDF